MIWTPLGSLKLIPPTSSKATTSHSPTNPKAGERLDFFQTIRLTQRGATRETNGRQPLRRHPFPCAAYRERYDIRALTEWDLLFRRCADGILLPETFPRRSRRRHVEAGSWRLSFYGRTRKVEACFGLWLAIDRRTREVKAHYGTIW